MVDHYEIATPHSLYTKHGRATGYDTAYELASSIPDTKSGRSGDLERRTAYIALRDVEIFETAVPAPAIIPMDSLKDPTGQSYWPFNDDSLRLLFSERRNQPASSQDTTNFDPAKVQDARDLVLRAIRARRGQENFRVDLLAAYQGRCAITGCAVTDVLEAAHITPYRGLETNHVTNGLLLRADLHTLHDCMLMAVRPDTLNVVIAPPLLSSSYRNIASLPLNKTVKAEDAPSRKALEQHFCDFQKRHPP